MRARTVTAAAACLCVAVLTMAVTGASPQKKQTLGETRPDKALLYMFRQGHLVGAGVTVRVYAEDTLAGVLSNGAYTFTHLDPGSHLLWYTAQKDPIVLDVAAGRTYYVTFLVGEMLTPLSDAEGQKVLAKATKYRAASESDRTKAAKEGREKWAQIQKKRPERVALAKADVEYAPPASTEGLMKVPASTPVQAALMENLSSDVSRPGDTVWLQTTADVTVDGKIIVPKGAPLAAIVRDVRDTGTSGRAAMVDIGVLSVPAADGSRYPIVGQMMSRGEDHTKQAAGAAIGIGLWAAFIRGGEAYRVAGESATVYIKQDVWFNPKAEGAPTPPAAADDAAIVRGTVSGAVACDMEHGEGPAKVSIAFQVPGEFTAASLVGVGDATMPKPVPAIRVTGAATGPSVDFNGWQVCRFLRPGLDGVDLAIDLTRADGSVTRTLTKVLLLLKK